MLLLSQTDKYISLYYLISLSCFCVISFYTLFINIVCAHLFGSLELQVEDEFHVHKLLVEPIWFLECAVGFECACALRLSKLHR